MAGVTATELAEISAMLTTVRETLSMLSVDPIKFYDSNGEYVGQIKHETANGYMFLMPGDPEEENVTDDDR